MTNSNNNLLNALDENDSIPNISLQFCSLALHIPPLLLGLAEGLSVNHAGPHAKRINEAV